MCTALWSFVNFCCLSQSEVSTDNRKVSAFFVFQHVRCRCCYRSYLDRFLKPLLSSLFIVKPHVYCDLFLNKDLYLSNVRKFSLRFQVPKIFNSLSSEIQSSLLNWSHFSWHKHTLLLLMLACSTVFASFPRIFAILFLTFSFLHLRVQPYLFLSHLIIIFYVVKKLDVFS